MILEGESIEPEDENVGSDVLDPDEDTLPTE
jgi:hypothetical protein